jgi:hypothetical protein
MGMTAADDDDLVTPKEAAQILRIAGPTLRRIPETDLPVVLRIGARRDRRYRRRDVLALRDRWQGGEPDVLIKTLEAVDDPAARARAALMLLDQLGDLIPAERANELRAWARAQLKDPDTGT